MYCCSPIGGGFTPSNDVAARSAVISQRCSRTGATELMNTLEAGLWSEPSGMKISTSALASALSTGGPGFDCAKAASATEAAGSALGGAAGAARATGAVFSFFQAFCNSATDTEFLPRGDEPAEPLDPRDETRL